MRSHILIPLSGPQATGEFQVELYTDHDTQDPQDYEGLDFAQKTATVSIISAQGGWKLILIQNSFLSD